MIDIFIWSAKSISGLYFIPKFIKGLTWSFSFTCATNLDEFTSKFQWTHGLWKVQILSSPINFINIKQYKWLKKLNKLLYIQYLASAILVRINLSSTAVIIGGHLDFFMTAILVLFVHLVLHMHFNSLVVPFYSCRHRLYFIHLVACGACSSCRHVGFLLALSNFGHQLLILCLFLLITTYLHFYCI